MTRLERVHTRLLHAALVLVLLCGTLAARELAADGQRRPAADTYLVTRVVDGDTLILERLGRVRLIGIDSPESVDPRRPVQRFGKQASTFTRRLVDRQRVRVEYDRSRKDRYNRTLAYVYLMDGTFVNAEILRQGYAFVYTRAPFRYLDAFRRYEREARQQKRGLWAPD